MRQAYPKRIFCNKHMLCFSNLSTVYTPNMKLYQFCLLTSITLITQPSLTWAQASSAPPAADKICLVLSGGGARGAAHVGVLKVLERLRIPISCIVGTSMGAIVGAAYASGRNADQLEQAIGTMTTDKLMLDQPPRNEKPMRRKVEDEREYIGPEVGLSLQHGLLLPKGAVTGTALEAVLRELTASQENIQFADLPTPFRAVATDLATGEMQVFDEGNLSRVIRASMSVPGAIAPVEINGRLLADGGLVRNLPVDVARAMGAQRVIAVNLGTPLLKREQITDALSVTNQMINILTEQNVRASLDSLRANDVLIAPELGSASAADFSSMAKLIPLGEAAALVQIEKLRPLGISELAYAQWQLERTNTASKLQARIQQDKTIARIEVQGTQRVNPAMILAALQTRPGQALKPAMIDADLRRLYGWGDFESLNYSVQDDAKDERVLLIEVHEKSWGPSYLRLGFGLESRLGGGSSFDLLLNLRRTWLNNLGAEWSSDIQIGQRARIATQWYQPLDEKRQFFAELSGHIAQQPINYFSNGLHIASINSQTALLNAELGINLGNNSQLRLGYEHGKQRFMRETGDANLPASLSSTIAAWNLKFSLDTSNSGTFATEGERFNLDLRTAQLSNNHRYTRWHADWRHAFSLGPNVMQLFASGGGALGKGELPIFEYFSLGGPLRLAAYPSERFSGPGYSYASILYARRILKDRYCMAAIWASNSTLHE